MLYSPPDQGRTTCSGGGSSKKNAGAKFSPGVFSGGNAATVHLLPARSAGGSRSLALADWRAG